MADELIPVEVQQFILNRIDSIAQLEALVLFTAQPGEAWAATVLARRLYISDADTVALLGQLQTEGLVSIDASEPPLYRYTPASDELAQLVARVVESYRMHLVPVTNLVHAKPKTRIQQFADAFKFRKDE